MQIRLFARTGMPLPGLSEIASLQEMKHQLDFEKPILELESKLEELKTHPEEHSMDVNFEVEILPPNTLERALSKAKRVDDRRPKYRPTGQ